MFIYVNFQGGGKKPIGVYLAMFLRGIFILLHGQMGLSARWIMAVV